MRKLGPREVSKPRNCETREYSRSGSIFVKSSKGFLTKNQGPKREKTKFPGGQAAKASPWTVGSIF